MRVGVDVDGVLYHWERTARYLLRTERGCVNLDHASTDWNMIQRRVAPQDWRWLWREGVELGLYRHGHLMTGAIEGMRALEAAGHDLVVVTHRPAEAVHDTLAFLSYHFNDVDLAGVHILGGSAPKSSIACDVLIDDKPENIDDWLDNTSGHAVLFDQPWNRDYRVSYFTLERFERAVDWREAVSIIEEIAQ